jgi:hypothetical protein
MRNIVSIALVLLISAGTLAEARRHHRGHYRYGGYAPFLKIQSD